MTKLKVCGITNFRDLNMCMEIGIDLIGFNLYPRSKRYAGGKIKKLLAQNKVKKRAVIIGVNEDIEFWKKTVKNLKPSYIQLHGDENIEYLKKVAASCPKVNIIKKVKIEDADTFEENLIYADYLLCDTTVKGYGGAGKKFNWKKLKNINKSIRDKLFVAGGIDSSNIKELLSYDIYGVDVASGTEKRPGKKDRTKIIELKRKVDRYG